MANKVISVSNIQSHIDLFTTDFNSCKETFENIDSTIIKLKWDHQSRKSDVKETLRSIHSDLFRKLNGINQIDIEEEFLADKYVEEMNSYNGVLDSYKERIETLKVDILSFSSKASLNLNENLPNKETKFNFSANDSPKSSSKPNFYILNSRQTDEPFMVMTMKAGNRYKCSGCNQNIPLKSLFLSHIEEYPTGSKTFRPHSYHISQECLLNRKFEPSYLAKINVKSNEAIDKKVNEILKEIGFNTKNIYLTDSLISDSDSEESSDDDNVPDNISEKSDISSVPSVVSLTSKVTFYYHRKPPNQKKVIKCKGCMSVINTETYISLHDNSDSTAFHVKKPCLKLAESLPDDFSCVTCKVFRLLKTHGELKELLACGFYYNKIIGFRPPNPNAKQKHKTLQNKKPGDKPMQPKASFIFNEEPFVYEKLPHGEKCQGCQKQIKKDETTLRHKERVPREKLEYSPLISQYYHAQKDCLLARGFTLKYLSFIKCNAILSGNENLSRVTEVLIKCGLYSENICYTPGEKSENRGFEASAQPSKLYIDKYAKGNAHCEGCGFLLIPGQPCFVYGLTPSQDSHAKIFHIRSSCLKVNFSKEQLMSITCVNNDSVDVSPNEIINCGITKIVTENKFNPESKSKQNYEKRNCRKKSFSFDVDIVVDTRLKCYTCRQGLILDKYVLKIRDKDPDNALIHLNPGCVKRLGLPPAELAGCDLFYKVFVSPEGITKLRDCGFRKLNIK